VNKVLKIRTVTNILSWSAVVSLSKACVVTGIIQLDIYVEKMDINLKKCLS
jgi:hypothetical protein